MYFFLICGFYSVNIGFDNTYEFKLYHLWNGYSFADNRFSEDFAFVGIQSYLNPLFDWQYLFQKDKVSKEIFYFLYFRMYIRFYNYDRNIFCMLLYKFKEIIHFFVIGMSFILFKTTFQMFLRTEP